MKTLICAAAMAIAAIPCANAHHDDSYAYCTFNLTQYHSFDNLKTRDETGKFTNEGLTSSNYWETDSSSKHTETTEEGGGVEKRKISNKEILSSFMENIKGWSILMYNNGDSDYYIAMNNNGDWFYLNYSDTDYGVEITTYDDNYLSIYWSDWYSCEPSEEYYYKSVYTEDYKKETNYTVQSGESTVRRLTNIYIGFYNDEFVYNLNGMDTTQYKYRSTGENEWENLPYWKNVNSLSGAEYYDGEIVEGSIIGTKYRAYDTNFANYIGID